MKKRYILAGGLVVLCIGCLTLGLLADLPAPEVPVAVDEPTPAVPQATATPPSTPTPAPTPTPAMLTVRDIEVQRKQLTDLQWEPYAEGLVGEQIRFSGKVVEVYGDGRVQIDDGKGIFTVCILYGVPLDVAAGLSKDQVVEGQGTVREVDTTIGLSVRVDVGEIH